MVELAAGHNNIGRESKPRKIWAAVLLSLFFPGMGQYYNGEIKRAAIIIGLDILGGFIGKIAIYFIGNIIPLIITILLVIAIWLFALADTILLTRNNRQGVFLSKYNDKWLKYLGVIVAIIIIEIGLGYIEETFIVEAFRMPSGSMENTILIGDYLIGKKCGAGGIDINDVIVFKYPNDPHVKYIKRCVAKGGQKIEIKKKKLYVDDEFVPLPENGRHTDIRVIPHNGGLWGMGTRDNMPPRIVPEGHLFVLGDNRDNSADSRFWGFLDVDLVLGKAMFIHWSWAPNPDVPQSSLKRLTYNLTNFANRVRWERIGKKLE